MEAQELARLRRERVTKLGKIAAIIARVAGMTGDEGAAIIWFKHQPIVGFGGRTAENLVEEGHADAVM